MSTTILLGYPLHLLGSGQINFTNIEFNTSSLTGNYLHFAYLVPMGCTPNIALDFSPNSSPCSISTGEIGALKKYAPDVSDEQMISVILKVLGDTILLPKPIRQN
jgi:hypothetical protein